MLLNENLLKAQVFSGVFVNKLQPCYCEEEGGREEDADEDHDEDDEECDDDDEDVVACLPSGPQREREDGASSWRPGQPGDSDERRPGETRSDRLGSGPWPIHCPE